MDYIDVLILESYHIIQRGRKQSEGFPLPLSVSDINDYVDAFPTALDNDIFYACIFHLDDMWLEHYYEKNKPKGGKTKGNSSKAIPI